MGICSSASEPDGERSPPKDANLQRRRLSVAPKHVDTHRRESTAPDLDYVEMEAMLTAEEKKSMGSMECGARSNKGHVPYNPDKVNQDRFVIKFNVGGNTEVALFGVFDGHGEHGHHVSSFVKTALPKHLSAHELIAKDPEKAIIQATADMVQELDRMSINTTFSGTTAIYAVKVGNKLYVANIGDSRCALGRRTKEGKYAAIGLSEDQKPDNPEEQKRILAAGGRVEPLPGMPGEDCGPHRVWLRNVDVPGLAMSRSIGDKISQRVGVISVPEIKTHELTGDDHFIVLASDGVWEFMENQEVVSFVGERLSDLKTASVELAQRANEKWKQNEEVIDDITCVIVKFNFNSSQES
uniref:PPM-type phosphatase domain-containing protein n=1 Tax=Lotharella oceanica TaxID=641309 RepID=A0A7S2U5W4_9EUKA|mmetsp:Transcript_9449/g.18371  ORF Transcript_9449/g.18371 Transcript_9449/m.18371 type:complete len:354 (+) Transcript_9449:30-1091(+)